MIKRGNLVADEYNSVIRAYHLRAHPAYLTAAARWLSSTLQQYAYSPAVAPAAFAPRGEVVRLLRDAGVVVWIDGPLVRLRSAAKAITEAELIAEVTA